MNHYSYEQWLQYVKNEVDENVRDKYDSHLYSCDQCLEVYLDAVAQLENELPMLGDQDEFTNLIMEKVVQPQRVPFYHSTLFHYAVAAVMTILFISTGVFQSITSYTDLVHTPTLLEEAPTLTDGIINKTFAWMDSLELNNEEGNK